MKKEAVNFILKREKDENLIVKANSNELLVYYESDPFNCITLELKKDNIATLTIDGLLSKVLLEK